MRTNRTRKWLGLLLAGAWLPITFSCYPEQYDGFMSVFTDGWYYEEVIIDPWYGGGGGYYFDVDVEYDD